MYAIRSYYEEGARYAAMGEKQLAREIRTLEKSMLEHARNLEFEQAANLRDKLAELKNRITSYNVCYTKLLRFSTRRACRAG